MPSRPKAGRFEGSGPVFMAKCPLENNTICEKPFRKFSERTVGVQKSCPTIKVHAQNLKYMYCGGKIMKIPSLDILEAKGPHAISPPP